MTSGRAGHGPVWLGIEDVRRQLKELVETTGHIHVTGPSGSGKEVAAQYVHQLIGGTKLVELNCATLDNDMVESELFGHEQGSFSGALRQHKGVFERANGGTLFLDEIGELPLRTQPKLLRAIDQMSFTRVGGERQILVDFRLITATKRDLEEMVGDKRFRDDLYYRICPPGRDVRMPSLKDRPLDHIQALAESFVRGWLTRQSGDTASIVISIRDDVYEMFLEYKWPGEVRELKGVVEAACAKAFRDGGRAIAVDDCQLGGRGTAVRTAEPSDGDRLMEFVTASGERSPWIKNASELERQAVYSLSRVILGRLQSELAAAGDDIEAQDAARKRIVERLTVPSDLFLYDVVAVAIAIVLRVDLRVTLAYDGRPPDAEFVRRYASRFTNKKRPLGSRVLQEFRLMEPSQ